MRYAFVILHYLVDVDTIECVDSLVNYLDKKDIDEKKIIIVDNGSNNGSYERIQKKYNNNSDIIFLKNDNNIGFAKGNNVGFKYAKEILKSDFIILLNNDTIITQRNFLYEISNLFKKYNFAILGPDIITKDGIHQNPFCSSNFNIIKLWITRFKQYVKIFLIMIGLDSILRNKKTENNYISYDLINADLHGACLIFSSNYINSYDGLCDGTFLYMEEEILKLYLKRKKLTSLYSPKLIVYHKEDMATNAACKSNKKSKINKVKWWIDSSYVYEREYKRLLKEKN